MKTASLLLKRILNNPFMFFITVFQIAIISAAMLGVYNAYVISHACIDSVSGENRMIYRSRSTDFEDENALLSSRINDIMTGSEGYLGTSFVADSFTYLGENASLEIARKDLAGEYIPKELFRRSKYEDIAATYFYNDITLRSIKYPLKKGSWEDIYSEKNGALPCFVGGKNSSKYSVGDIIHGFTFNGNANAIVNVDYYVAGILKDPLFLFSASVGGTDIYNTIKLSEVFDVGISEPLVIVTNSTLVEERDIAMMHTSGNYFVFFDGKTTDEQMEKYAVTLGDSYAAVDKDMIISEELEITSGAEVSLPIVILLLIISLCSIISVSVISFINSLDEYKIYCIFGCTERKMLLVNALYCVCCLAVSGIITVGLMKLLSVVVFDRFKPYFVNSFAVSAMLSAAFAVTAFASILIPFLLQKKKSVKELLLQSTN